MLSERLKTRLAKDRPTTEVTLHLPADVVEELKALAPRKGFQSYETLLKAYISDGLRQDEARFATDHVTRLIEALKRRGVPAETLDDAERELMTAAG